MQTHQPGCLALIHGFISDVQQVIHIGTIIRVHSQTYTGAGVHYYTGVQRDRIGQRVKQFLDDFDGRYGKLISESPTAHESAHRDAKRQHDADKQNGRIVFEFVP